MKHKNIRAFVYYNVFKQKLERLSQNGKNVQIPADRSLRGGTFFRFALTGYGESGRGKSVWGN
jgi:hypothetical protein